MRRAFGHTFIFLLIIGALASCKTETTTSRQAASNRASSSSTDLPPSRWPSTASFPLNLRPSDDFTANEIAVINTAGDSWSTAINDQLSLFDTSNSLSESEKSNLSSYQDSTYGVYKVFNWPSELPATALAVTQIYGLRKNIGKSSEYIKITHADILVNYDNYSFSTDGSYGYDLETVLLHEMGHFLGLYHDESSLSQSVMYPTVSKYVNNTTPKQNDIDALTAKYLSSSGSRSARDEVQDDAYSEPIEIVFEMHPNGVEKIRINKKELITKKCNHHNHSTTTLEK